MLKIKQKVKILHNYGGHNFKIGSIVEIVSINNEGDEYYAKGNDLLPNTFHDHWYITESEVLLMIPFLNKQIKIL